MEIDKLPSEEEINESLVNDILSRKSRINSLLKLLNFSKESGPIIAVDGDWGSGKTFLMKQLESLWYFCLYGTSSQVNNTVDLSELKSFYDNYIPFYYNAWENDYSPDATQSILLSLLEYIKEKDSFEDKAGKKILENIDFGSLLNNISKGLIDTNKKNELTLETNRAKKTREKISELIDEQIGLNGRKFLFIIDDLDRCKPTYAIDVIESIKHHFSNKQIVFLVATNMRELANIVSGYYGSSFDGGKYLERIFDVTTNVGQIDITVYLGRKLLRHDYYTLKKIPAQLKLTMREANRYASVINILDGYISVDPYVNIQNERFRRHFLLPLFVACRIKEPKMFYKMIKEPDETAFLDLVKRLNNSLIEWVYGALNSSMDGKRVDNIDKDLVSRYKQLFDANDREDFYRDEFWNALGVISGISLRLE